MTYGVYHKELKAYFAGFTSEESDAQVIWVKDKAQAKRMDRQSAKCQAALFVSCGLNGTQRKPVIL